MLRISLAFLVMLSACRETAQPPPQAAPPSAAAPATADDGAIALVPMKGDAPIDRELRALQTAVQRLPDRADGWVRLAEGWVKKARNAQAERLYERAEAAARRAMVLSPNNPGAQRVLALALQNAHRFKEMRALATNMTRAAPRSADGWGLLCDAALELGDYPAAEAACQQMVDLAPGLPAWVRAAWLRWITGDADGALALWHEALRVVPTDDIEPRAWVFSEVGHLSWSRGRLEEAAAAYAQALVLQPNHAPSLFGRGRLALARGDAAAAVQDLRDAAAARASEVTSYWLAAALRAAGQPAEAATLEAALTAASDFDDPRSTALFLATHRRDPQRAIDLARRDFEARGDVFSEDALSFALFRAGRLDEAAVHSARALRLKTPDPLLWAHAGLLAAAQGRTTEARALLTGAQALNPHFDPVLGPEVAAALAALPPEAP